MTGSEGPDQSNAVGFDALRRQAYGRPPGDSMWIPKDEMPALPSEFSPTLLGTPLWIAHPGSRAQYRATPALHAYELDDGWRVHRDRFDTDENPLGHILFDAPELILAALAGIFAGIATYLALDKREKEKGDEGRLWIPVLAGLFAGIAAFLAVYVLGAMVRVALGVG